MTKQKNKALLKYWRAVMSLAAAFVCGFIACLCWQFFRDCGVEPQVKKPTITEQLKSVQRQVGCIKIDAKVWGPESKGLLKPIIEKEEQELFNSYAAVYMTPTGVPK